MWKCSATTPAPARIGSAKLTTTRDRDREKASRNLHQEKADLKRLQPRLSKWAVVEVWRWLREERVRDSSVAVNQADQMLINEEHGGSLSAHKLSINQMPIP